MTTKKLPLAVALAAFAMACSDPTATTRTLVPSTSSFAEIPHLGYPFPSSPTDGLVRLCKVSNVEGTFGFDVTLPGGGVTEVSINVGAGQVNTPVCAVAPLYNSNAAGNVAETVTIVEDNPGANWAVAIDIDQYYDPANVNYDPIDPLGDTFTNATRTATVVINDDLEKVVTFTNTYTETPPPEICDFVTFGRLVWEQGGQKVVISGNAGGFNADGSIKGEFHIEVNGTDHHVADVTTYGPIASDALVSTTYTNSRLITGTDKHGHPVALRLWDGGEPGKNTDRFWFNVNGTIVGDAVDGNLIDQGNMQYHPVCRGPDQN